MAVDDLRTLDEDDGRGRRAKNENGGGGEHSYSLQRETSSSIYSDMYSRGENCTGVWVRPRIFSTGTVYSHNVSVHTVQMQ